MFMRVRGKDDRFIVMYDEHKASLSRRRPFTREKMSLVARCVQMIPRAMLVGCWEIVKGKEIEDPLNSFARPKVIKSSMDDQMGTPTSFLPSKKTLISTYYWRWYTIGFYWFIGDTQERGIFLYSQCIFPLGCWLECHLTRGDAPKVLCPLMAEHIGNTQMENSLETHMSREFARVGDVKFLLLIRQESRQT